jgi:alcohol dehydrogenase, propanol-preferring
MRAMVLDRPRERLVLQQLPEPKPGNGQVLIRVAACGICRTDLHLVDGELTNPKLPIIPGHEIVGTVAARGPGAERFAIGERVGVAWLGHTCGQCPYCRRGQENLCDSPDFTGYTIDGGYADFTVADENFCFRVPTEYDSTAAAPLLCAGLIGYRSLIMAGPGNRLGIFGFGAAAHIITQVARHQGRRVFAFTRPGDAQAQQFARDMGAEWAGDSGSLPPAELDAAIIFAPVGALVPEALRTVSKGGVVVCGGIHMSTIPSFDYSLMWGERIVRSVANLTRRDGEDFLVIAPQIPVRTETELFPLEAANEALDRLRRGQMRGAAVLVP